MKNIVNIYQKLNLTAKDYFFKKLSLKKFKVYDNDILYRCYKEINLLYENNILFVIEYLDKYKKINKNIFYEFSGAINNLLVLYLLDLSNVDPRKYNLSYELYFNETLSVNLVNESIYNFINYLNTNIKDFNFVLDKDQNYLVIPKSCENECYLTIKIGEAYYSDKKPDYDKINKLLESKTLENYIEYDSMSPSKKEETFRYLIRSKDDIFNYLIAHSIDKDVALDITKWACMYKNSSSYTAKTYKKIMQINKCDKTFINFISKLLYIQAKGEEISKCLFILEGNNAQCMKN